jgi:hypothetical protein
MLPSKKIPVKGLCGIYLSEAQNPIPPPLLHPVNVYTVYLFTQGRGGRKGRGVDLNQREG